jgi:hypothetical protein
LRENTAYDFFRVAEDRTARIVCLSVSLSPAP